MDAVICWLTGYSVRDLAGHLVQETDFETFLMRAPQPNPARKQITGTVCGVRVEDVEDPIMQEIRYLDKLIDELVKGRPLEKVLRQS